MKPIQAHNPFPDRDRERTRLRKSKVLAFVAVGFMVALALTVTARSWDDHHEPKVKLLGNIPIPAPNPISSTDITWADQATGKVFFSDRSNAAVEVLDGAHDLFVGRITKNAAGTLTYTGTGGAGGSSHEGPNGVVSTADKKVWAGDGDSTVKVADFDPSSPTYLQIIASVNTAGLSSVSACTGGITGTCNRDDEIAYDSEHEIIMVTNDEPTAHPAISHLYQRQISVQRSGSDQLCRPGPGGERWTGAAGLRCANSPFPADLASDGHKRFRLHCRH